MIVLKLTLDEQIAGDNFCLCTWDLGLSFTVFGSTVSAGFLVEIADVFPDCLSVTYGCCKICCKVCKKDNDVAKRTASMLMTDSNGHSQNRSPSYISSSPRSPSMGSGSPRGHVGATELVAYGKEAHKARKETQEGTQIFYPYSVLFC